MQSAKFAGDAALVFASEIAGRPLSCGTFVRAFIANQMHKDIPHLLPLKHERSIMCWPEMCCFVNAICCVQMMLCIYSNRNAAQTHTDADSCRQEKKWTSKRKRKLENIKVSSIELRHLLLENRKWATASGWRGAVDAAHCCYCRCCRRSKKGTNTNLIRKHSRRGRERECVRVEISTATEEKMFRWDFA